MATSPLKYAGGKARLAPELSKLIPAYVGSRPDRRYFEPFFGGGALFWAMSEATTLSAGPGPASGSMPYAVIGDANVPLMCAFRAIRENIEQVVAFLRWHASEHAVRGRDHYYEQRGVFNARRTFSTRGGVTGAEYPEDAARFLYLNKACFNGLWRVNRAGDMNTPAGDMVVKPELVESVNPVINEANLRACADALVNTSIKAGDYTETIRDVKAGDFAYLDCPYHDTFSSYTADGFDDDDHAALAQVAKDLVKLGARVLISNSDTPFVREIYAHDDFKIGTLPCMHSMAASGEKRKRVDELVIVGGGVSDWKQTELLL